MSYKFTQLSVNQVSVKPMTEMLTFRDLDKHARHQHASKNQNVL